MYLICFPIKNPNRTLSVKKTSKMQSTLNFTLEILPKLSYNVSLSNVTDLMVVSKKCVI